MNALIKTILTVLALLAFLPGAAHSQTPADIPSGMVAWWRGENNAQDSLVANPGTMNNPVIITPGKVGNGFSFGANGYVFVPHSSSLSNQQFTIETWVQPDGPGPNNDAGGSYLIGRITATGGCSSLIGIAWRATDNRFRFAFGDAAGTEIITSSNGFAPGQYYHVVASYDGAVFRLYVNGALEAQMALVKTMTYPATDGWYIGSTTACARSFGFPRTWNGVIDELSIYNRTLSVAEITSIYNAGSSGKYANKPYFLTPGPLADGGVGTPYSFQFAAAVTPGPHTFSVVNGTLPPGLELSTNGLLYGTPTASTTNSFDILATSSGGQTNTHPFTLQIRDVVNPVPAGLVAWWRAQNDALDATGASHGTLRNGATYSQGRVGQAFSLDGADDYVEVGNPPALQLTGSFTLDAWVNPAPASNQLGTILSKWVGSAGLDCYGLYLLNLGGNLTVAGAIGNGTPEPAVIGGSVPPGQWSHVLMTYEASDGLNVLYVNGQAVASRTRTGGTLNSTRQFLIGRQDSGELRSFAGLIDEVSVYNRALTASEVTTLYNASAGKSGLVYITSLSPLPGAGQGALYSQPLITAGGTAPYTYTLLNGALPEGLNLSSAGVLSGTPTGFGTSEFTVRVTDEQTRPAERHFSVKVNARPVLGVMTNRPANEMTLLTVANPGTDADALDTLTYELVSPPAGAAIDAAGTITWTPAEAQGLGVFTITTKVTDNATPPLSTTNSFTVTVNEVNLAPALSVQANRTINELTLLTVANPGTDPDLPANGLSYALTEAPAGAAIDAAGTITWTPTEAQGPGVFTITTKVTDNGTPALSTTNSFTVTVNEVNLAPSLSVQANRTINELTPLTVTNPGTDPDLPSNGLSYALVDAPEGASIDAAGTITWTPTEAQGPGVFTITTKVTDNGVPPLSATNSFTVTVNEVNAAPSLPVQANRTVDELTLLTVANPGTDSDLPANGLSYALLEAPAGASISAAGTLTWTPTEAQGPGVFTFTTKVTDNGTPPLSTTNSFTVTVNEVNTAPSLPVQANRTIDELTLLSVSNTATDTDAPTNTLTYSLVSPPAGAAIDGSGKITWTPTEAQGPGVFTITTNVTDNGTPPLSTTNGFTVTVNEVNTAPSHSVQANRTVDELTPLSVSNPATDGDTPANTLTYSLVSPPAGAAIDGSGNITWTPAEAQGPGVFTITTKITDNGTPPLSTTNAFTVTVTEKNTAPVLPPLSDITIDPGQSISFSAAASDGDLPPNGLAYSLTAPAGATINPQTGQFQWRPSVSLAGASHVVTVKVADDSTPSAGDSRTFTVIIRPLQEFTMRSTGFAGGSLHFEIDGPLGPDYTLQRSTDMLNWENVSTQTPRTMPLTLSEVVGPQAGRRFYRVQAGPFEP